MDDVRIRLEVEGMRHQVVHAFAAHQGVIREIVDQRLADALDDFRVDDEVDRAIRAELQSTIGKIIQTEVAAVLGSREVLNAVQIGVGTALVAALTARGLLPREEKEE